MANRRKLAAAAAGSVLAAGAFARARRRARAAGRGFVEDIMPSVLEEPPTPKMAGFDDAHAPGHRHLPLEGWVSDAAEPAQVRSRPFAKHRHGLRHPGRG